MKDLADLHTLRWYVTDHEVMKTTVREQITRDDVTTFESAIEDGLYDRPASLIEVDSTVVRQSVEQLWV